MKALSIIQFTSPGENWGGIEQHVRDLGAGLTERGHKVVFASRPMPHAVAKLREVGEVYTYPMINALDVKTILGVARLIGAKAADIVHAHTSRDTWNALFATMVAGRGRVVTTRHVPLAAKKDLLHAWFYNRLGAILCVSEYVRGIVTGDPPRVDPAKVRVAYPVVSLERYTRGAGDRFRRAWKLAAGDFAVGFVGRITVEKGLDDLIDAAGLLRKDHPSLKLVLVGQVNADTPEYLDQLKSRAAARGVGDSVVFQEFTPDMADVVQALDCVAVPSIIPETFGLALCEALAGGRPVIASDTGAQREIVREGETGYIVPPRQPAALAGAIGRLAGDRPLARAMGEAGRRDVLERFGAERTIGAVESCYWNVLGK